MNNLDEKPERTSRGAAHLILWGALLVVGTVIVFAFGAVVGTIIFREVSLGVIFAVAVTVVLGYLLHAVGKRFM
jgi:hypothetical protein